VGRRIVARIEAEAARAGHRTFELLALLSSVRFYRRIGYQDLAICALELQNGVTLPSVHMRKAASTEVAANG
ncbi:MAG: hypothetical protein ACREH6_03970, partial [Geminicoccaceae bacterium]